MQEKDKLAGAFMSIRDSLGRAVQHIVPPGEIEDIVQETYVRVSRVIEKKNIRSPRSFMFRTARNLALDYVKRAETRLADSIDHSDNSMVLPSDRDDTLARVTSEEEFSRFCDAVSFPMGIRPGHNHSSFVCSMLAKRRSVGLPAE